MTSAIKNLNIPLTSEELEELNRLKGEMTWREFILQFTKPKKRGGKK